jgi:hypothetical protein
MKNNISKPVGSLFISSTAKEGPDRTINGWRRFPNARGMILDIVRRVLSSSPLLSDMNGNFGSTCVEMPSRKDELNCRKKISESKRMKSLQNAQCFKKKCEYLDWNSMEAEISSC